GAKGVTPLAPLWDRERQTYAKTPPGARCPSRVAGEEQTPWRRRSGPGPDRAARPVGRRLRGRRWASRTLGRRHLLSQGSGERGAVPHGAQEGAARRGPTTENATD